MLNVRLRFSKTFGARYISHLDLARCFSRAVKQSGLDVWYTEGFNTHLYITFALPLSLGFESICEIADIRLNGDAFDDYIAEKINRYLPHGIEIYDAGQPVQKTSEIAWSHYKIELAGGADIEKLLENADILSKKDEIVITKKSKKGKISDVDIKPLVHSFDAAQQNDICYIDAVLASGNEKTLNPQVLMDMLFDNDNIPDHQLVKRIRILNARMENFE